jgi:hypothetical protein
MIINTDYYYKEEWQYQTIQLDTGTLDIVRSQNYKILDKIQHSVDIIPMTDSAWEYLFKAYGYDALMRHNKGLLNGKI